MLGYEFRKWYFDILTPEHDFILMYIGHTRLLGFSQCVINLSIAVARSNVPSVHVAFPVKKSSLENDCRLITTNVGDICITHDMTRLQLAHADTRVDLEYQPCADKPAVFPSMTIYPQAKSSLVWNPISLKSLVHGTVALKDRELKIDSCNGYIDFVYSTIFPPCIPVRTVIWGRLHHKKIDLTYTHAEGARQGQQWRKLIIRIGRNTVEFDRFTITTKQQRFSTVLNANYPMSYEVTCISDFAKISLTIEHISNAVESDFVSDQDFKSPMVKKFIGHAIKNPRGVKFQSKASVHVEIGSAYLTINDVPMIDEIALLGLKVPVSNEGDNK